MPVQPDGVPAGIPEYADQWGVQIRDVTGTVYMSDHVLVEFDIEGQGLMLDSPEDGLRAAVIAAATSVPDFPGDGSVILAEWAAEFIPLRPNTTAEEILAARA